MQGQVVLGQAEPTKKGSVYVTANALMSRNISLIEAMRMARSAGAEGFEVRRELLPPNVEPEQWQQLRTQLEEFPSRPSYSTPQPLFKKGHFEQSAVLQALNEARALNCWLAKFNLGEPELDKDQFDIMQAALSDWLVEAPDLHITVENGQTAADGDVERWTRFFQQIDTQGGKIRMTFDLGNWGCVGIDSLQAAQALGKYVVYLHTKSVERVGNRCDSQPVVETSIPHPVLAYLPNNVPRALEFPVDMNFDTSIETLRSYMNWLRTGNFGLR